MRISSNYTEILKAAEKHELLYVKKGECVSVSSGSIFKRAWYCLRGWSREKTIVANTIKACLGRTVLASHNGPEIVWARIQLRELASRLGKSDKHFDGTLHNLEQRSNAVYQNMKEGFLALRPSTPTPPSPDSHNSSASLSSHSSSSFSSSPSRRSESRMSISSNSSIPSGRSSPVSSVSDVERTTDSYFTEDWVPFLRNKGFSQQEIGSLWTKIQDAPKEDLKFLDEQIEFHLSSPRAQRDWFTNFKIRKQNQDLFQKPKNRPSVVNEQDGYLERGAKGLANVSLKEKMKWVYGINESDWKTWNWNDLLTTAKPSHFVKKLDQCARESLHAKFLPLIQAGCQQFGLDFEETQKEFKRRFDEIHTLHLNQEIQATDIATYGESMSYLPDVWDLVVDKFLSDDARGEKPTSIEDMNQLFQEWVQKDRSALNKQRSARERQDGISVKLDSSPILIEGRFIDPKEQAKALQPHIEWFSAAVRGQGGGIWGDALDEVIVDFQKHLKVLYRELHGSGQTQGPVHQFGESKEAHAIWKAAVLAIEPGLKRIDPSFRDGTQLLLDRFKGQKTISFHEMQSAITRSIVARKHAVQNRNLKEKSQGYSSRLTAPIIIPDFVHQPSSRHHPANYMIRDRNQRIAITSSGLRGASTVSSKSKSEQREDAVRLTLERDIQAALSSEN